jgi:cation transport ATPase
MPILVICTGCHKRFKVSDKFAGKSGPCPQCKTVLQIPTLDEEVKVHAPEEFGGKNAEGKGVYKPIAKEPLSVTPIMWTLTVGLVVLVPVIAFVLGRIIHETLPLAVGRMVTLGVGALLVAPMLVWAGYSFLRNDELEPYRGTALWIRVTICSVIYAALWGVYAYMVTMLVGDAQPESIIHLLVIVPVLVVAGGLTSLATLELDATAAGLHYGFYLLATVVLRLIMGIGPF